MLRGFATDTHDDFKPQFKEEPAASVDDSIKQVEHLPWGSGRSPQIYSADTHGPSANPLLRPLFLMGVSLRRCPHILVGVCTEPF